MSKQRVQNELNRLFKDKFTYAEVKKQTQAEDVHLITFNPLDAKGQFAKGFEKSITAAANGFTSAEKRELNAINTTTSWAQAIRSAISGIQTDASPVNIEPLGSLIPVKELSGLVRGLYITPQSTPSNATFVTLNRNVAGGDIGEKGISQGLRRLTWESWKENLPTKYRTKIEKTETRQAGTPPGMGRAVQFAHAKDSTVGTDFLRVFNEHLTQSTDSQFELGFDVQLVFLDVAEQIREKANVNFARTRVIDEKGRVYEKRIIRGDLGKFNKKGSESTDLSKVKSNMKKLLNKILDNRINQMTFMSKKEAAEAQLSKPFKDIATEETIRKLKLPLTKKGTVDKRFKVVKDFIKLEKNKKRVVEDYTAYKGGGTTKGVKRSRAKVKGIAGAIALQQNRNKTKEVNLAKIMMLINKSLADTVKRNMGRPSLINRTGRFAESAQVVSMTPAKQTIVTGYTYQLNPYETFENTGERSWPGGYNPKPLIAKSIREEAAKYLQTKLTVRRV